MTTGTGDQPDGHFPPGGKIHSHKGGQCFSNIGKKIIHVDSIFCGKLAYCVKIVAIVGMTSFSVRCIKIFTTQAIPSVVCWSPEEFSIFLSHCLLVILEYILPSYHPKTISLPPFASCIFPYSAQLADQLPGPEVAGRHLRKCCWW